MADILRCQRCWHSFTRPPLDPWVAAQLCAVCKKQEEE